MAPVDATASPDSAVAATGDEERRAREVEKERRAREAEEERAALVAARDVYGPVVARNLASARWGDRRDAFEAIRKELEARAVPQWAPTAPPFARADECDPWTAGATPGAPAALSLADWRAPLGGKCNCNLKKYSPMNQLKEGNPSKHSTTTCLTGRQPIPPAV